MDQKKILIVGGGVAGLALAGFIEKYNIGKVVIIEQAPKFGTIGFLIGLWGNGRKILKEIGIDKEIVEDNGHEILSSIFEDSKRLLKESIIGLWLLGLQEKSEIYHYPIYQFLFS